MSSTMSLVLRESEISEAGMRGPAIALRLRKSAPVSPGSTIVQPIPNAAEVAECAGDAVTCREQLFRHHAAKAVADAGNEAVMDEFLRG
ncbi:hypothetical protein [Saccharopolyspora mangrovi]|uniref:Uncharacterized protein n=1 Tax=Saccharopolyspora mangrovi TaxID=3082379 RepID=A0ABU6AHK3_9PSEU|nr:hypothetical protein [Saccharopolyspora sp. S2-29]MEB3370906.1 hypothetical protein [Saccharopolyspora sp. S2-29]